MNKNNLSYDNKIVIKVVENLSSFMKKKRARNKLYKVQEDIIEVILEQI